MTLTPWFCAVTQPPVRAGWYDVQYCCDICFYEGDVPIFRLLWTGRCWRGKDGRIMRHYGWYGDRWRGLLREGDDG